MKKLWISCVALMLALAMSACSTPPADHESTTEADTELETTTQAETEAQTEEIVPAESKHPDESTAEDTSESESESESEAEEETKGLGGITVNSIVAYSPLPSTQTCDHAINVDDEYYVYYFYLGDIRNTPVYSSVALQYMFDEQVTFTFSRLTEQAVQQQLERSETAITHSSYTGGFAVSAEVGKQDVAKIGFSTDHHWTGGWENTVTVSESNVSSYVNADTASLSTTISFSEQQHTKGHFYRVSFYETARAYGVVVYDVKAQTYSVEYRTLLNESSRTRVWEESEDGTFTYEKEGELVFDTDAAIAYASSHTPTEKVVTKEVTAEKIDLSLTRHNCNEGNNFDKRYEEENATWRSRHDNYELGQLSLYGCVKQENTYVVVEPSELALRYQVTQNLNRLPLVGNAEGTNLYDDNATTVLDTNINSKVGYGAYWVRVTYADDSQVQWNATNVLADASVGTVVTLADSSRLDVNKAVKKVEIVLVYELHCTGHGVMGIAWHEHTNWRCETTLHFK